MAEITCDQVCHEDEVPGFAIASGAGLSRLDQSVYGLNRAVAQRAVEAVQDAVPVGFCNRAFEVKRNFQHGNSGQTV